MTLPLNIVAVIKNCLDHHCYKNATFLAERLRAEVKSDETLYLLGLCYYRSNRHCAAKILLQSSGSASPKVQLLLAQCFYSLNQMLQVELVLNNGATLKCCDLEDLEKKFAGLTPFAFELLATICLQTERPALAFEIGERALKLNPFLWSLFELLCDKSAVFDSDTIFQTASPEVNELPPMLRSCGRTATPETNSLKTTPKAPKKIAVHNVTPLNSRSKRSCKSTYCRMPLQIQQLPSNKANMNHDMKNRYLKKNHEESNDDGIHLHGRNGFSYGTVSSIDDIQNLVKFPEATEFPNWHSLSRKILQILRLLGEAYSQLSQYNFEEAVKLFKTVPAQHFNTGYVLSLMGKAYFEQHQYQNCTMYFQQVRELEPYHDSMMEVYSTALWHLQDKITLTVLAEDLIALHKESVVTWCVVGNCFSIQNEHDAAIKFFQRAIQVDPNFAYAYTLLGHEEMLVGELDTALYHFRNAVRLNPRQYSAWCGIGNILFKQEKYKLCEIHYKRALDCSPKNSILISYMSAVQYALGKVSTAIETLTSGIQMDPANPVCKFKLAELYIEMGKYDEALTELQVLRKQFPREPEIEILTGKVFLKLGTTDVANMHFSWARDLTKMLTQ